MIRHRRHRRQHRRVSRRSISPPSPGRPAKWDMRGAHITPARCGLLHDRPTCARSGMDATGCGSTCHLEELLEELRGEGPGGRVHRNRPRTFRIPEEVKSSLERAARLVERARSTVARRRGTPLRYSIRDGGEGRRNYRSTAEIRINMGRYRRSLRTQGSRIGRVRWAT